MGNPFILNMAKAPQDYVSDPPSDILLIAVLRVISSGDRVIPCFRVSRTGRVIPIQPLHPLLNAGWQFIDNTADVRV